MFVHVVRGRARDAAAVREHLDVWLDEHEPETQGWVGTTSGVTADGEFVALVRWESEQVSEVALGRPEQAEWWKGMVGLLDGARVVSTPDCAPWKGGGSDDAGFVQVMEGRLTSRDAAVRTLVGLRRWEMPSRPDLLGAFIALLPDERYTASFYFTSEAEARAAEQRELPAHETAYLDEWRSILADITYLDLPTPGWTEAAGRRLSGSGEEGGRDVRAGDPRRVRDRARGAAGADGQRTRADHAAGAVGWLGGTAGVTEDGEFVVIERFESEEAARANSARPEQDEWWRRGRAALRGRAVRRHHRGRSRWGAAAPTTRGSCR